MHIFALTRANDLKKMLGEKLRKLRVSNGFLQKQIAVELDVNVGHVSKMESQEKPVSRHHLKKLAALFDVSEEELMTLWLADKFYEIAKDQPLALEALKVTKNKLLKIEKI